MRIISDLTSLKATAHESKIAEQSDTRVTLLNSLLSHAGDHLADHLANEQNTLLKSDNVTIAAELNRSLVCGKFCVYSFAEQSDTRVIMLSCAVALRFIN